MNSAQAEGSAPVSTRDRRQRIERKKPCAESNHAGCATCPMCQRSWMSPDRRLIKFCKKCRLKVPCIEVSSVVDNDFIYL